MSGTEFVAECVSAIGDRIMILKRMLRTSLCGQVGGQAGGLAGGLAALSVVLVLLSPRPVSADVVTGISNLSQANRLSIFHDYGLDSVGLYNGSVPGTPGSGMLTPLMGSWASTDTTGSSRFFELSASPIVGYDSNPEARRDAQGSIFGGADLNAMYRMNIGPDDPTIGSVNQFRLDYDATGAIYDGTVFNADTFQQTATGSYRRSALHDTVALGVVGKDQFTTEYGNAFLNTLEIEPFVEWFALPQTSVEANYDLTRFDYFIRPGIKKNPDSVRNTVNAEFHFYPIPQIRGPIPDAEDVLTDILRQSFHRVTVGYGAVFNEAAGSDYNYEANRVYVGIEGLHLPSMPDWSLDLLYAHEWDNYMDPNSEGPIVLAGSPKQVRRKDHLDVFTLRSSHRLFDLPENRGTLSTFLQWDLVADRSNFEARHFNEFVISGGFKYSY
jgi:hypothetical protein